MKKRHTFLKLFIIIAISLTVLISTFFLLLTKYFNVYYTNYKENEFQSTVQNIVSLFDNAHLSNDEMLTQVERIYDEYDSMMVLLPMDTKSRFADAGIFMRDRTDNAGIIDEVVQYSSENPIYGESIIKTITSSKDGLNYIIALQVININDEPFVMGTASSLRAIDEAMIALNSISWLVYLTAAAFSLVIALIIAKLITQPLIVEIERETALDNAHKDFIANASHELKTPISIISGYAESLKAGILSQEERDEYESEICDEAQKMGKLVRDLLETAVLQNDKYMPRMTGIRLDEQATQIIARLDGQMNGKSLVVDISRLDPAIAVVDESMMETVFINLFMNAISHTPRGGRIAVRLGKCDSSIRFEIENEGLPIPDEAIPHIWESFYRVDTAHNRADGRFGLGLFTVKTVLDKHHGTVGVVNVDGGVVFFFELPLCAQSSWMTASQGSLRIPQSISKSGVATSILESMSEATR